MLEYQCPDCHTTNTLHSFGCEFEGTSRSEFEKAHIDIIAVLSRIVCSKEKLIENCHEWDDLHEAVFERLCSINHVQRTDEGFYTIASPSERRRETVPYSEPLATIWREGTFEGCHDNGLFALMAFYSHLDLSWEETKQELLEWYQRTGTWERGGFDEPEPEALIEKKRHIWEEGYGWKTKGQQAKQVIEQQRPGGVHGGQGRAAP